MVFMGCLNRPMDTREAGSGDEGHRLGELGVNWKRAWEMCDR